MVLATNYIEINIIVKNRVVYILRHSCNVTLYKFFYFIVILLSLNHNALSNDNGHYLLSISGCLSCHAGQDNQELTGGKTIKSDYGDFIVPNITINNPTEDKKRAFIQALKSGKHQKYHILYPAFPYDYYSRLTDKDIHDMWEALIQYPYHDVQQSNHTLSFPFSIRLGVYLWKWLYFPSVLSLNVNDNALWQRGAYLAQTAMHCGACHAPRNIIGGQDFDDNGFVDLTGGKGEEGKKIIAITPEALLEKDYTIDDMVFFLETGLTPEGDSVGRDMAHIIEDMTSKLTSEDMQALSYYLLHGHKKF